MYLVLIYKPEAGLNPNQGFGQFEDMGTTFDAIDTSEANTGRLHTCDWYNTGTDTAIGAIAAVGAVDAIGTIRAGVVILGAFAAFGTDHAIDC